MIMVVVSFQDALLDVLKKDQFYFLLNWPSEPLHLLLRFLYSIFFTFFALLPFLSFLSSSQFLILPILFASNRSFPSTRIFSFYVFLLFSFPSPLSCIISKVGAYRTIHSAGVWSTIYFLTNQHCKRSPGSYSYSASLTIPISPALVGQSFCGVTYTCINSIHQFINSMPLHAVPLDSYSPFYFHLRIPLMRLFSLSHPRLESIGLTDWLGLIG